MATDSSTTVPVVLLTGGGSGIGLKATETLLKEHNAKVLVLTLEPTAGLDSLQKDFGSDRLLTVFGDATDESVNEKAISTLITNFSYITHLITCIGTMLPVKPIRSVSLASYKRIFDINFFSIFSIVQKCIPYLEKAPAPFKPTIAITSSGADKEVLYRGWSGYCASKAAVTRFVNVLAHEEPGMRVFGVLPGVTVTPMVDLITGGEYDEVMYPEEREKFARWEKNGELEPVEWPAGALVRGAMGLTAVESGEVRYWNKF